MQANILPSNTPLILAWGWGQVFELAFPEIGNVAYQIEGCEK